MALLCQYIINAQNAINIRFFFFYVDIKFVLKTVTLSYYYRITSVTERIKRANITADVMPRVALTSIRV